MTVVIEGRLEYLSWNRFWTVSSGVRSADLSAPFWQVAQRLKDQPVNLDMKSDSFTLRADPASEWVLEFEEIGGGIIVSRKGSAWGFTNVLSYIEAILCNINAQEVIASIEDDSFTVFANPTAQADVPGLKRPRDVRGNSIPISDDIVRTRCGAGTADACIFITASASGFACEKFNGSMTRMLLDRKAQGTMRASRIGNCRIDGWEGYP